MKRAKKVIEIDGFSFESVEELHFYYWLQEAKADGYIDYFEYHQTTFDLIPRQVEAYTDFRGRPKEKFLFHPVTYTPDFIFTATERLKNLLKTEQGTYYVDIKGGFEPTHSKEQVFSIVRKLVYYSKGIYIDKIIPSEWFSKTWVPDEAAYMSNRRELTRRKPYINCRLLREVPNANQERFL